MERSLLNRAHPVRYRRTILAVLLLGGTTLAGCGGDGVEATTTTTAPITTTAPTTTTTTAPTTTTTTLSDQSVLETFLGHITAPEFAGRAELTIRGTAGELTLSGSGTLEFVGEDSHMVMEIVGQPSRETISSLGVDYQRVADGPWVTEDTSSDPFAQPAEGEPVPLDDLELFAALRTLDALEHQAVGERDGLTLHRIGLPAGTEADPLAFGFGTDEQVDLQVVFFATAVGVPYEMLLTVDDVSDPELPLSMEFNLRFVETGIPIEISGPDDVWLKHSSDDLGYTIAHPAGWEIEMEREDWVADYFLGLQGEELDLYVTEIDPPERVALNAWLDSFRDSGITEGHAFGEAAEIEVIGLPGRMVSYTGEDDFGSFDAVYVVVQTDLDVVYEFIIFGDGEEAIRRLLDDFLSTFQPAS